MILGHVCSGWRVACLSEVVAALCQPAVEVTVLFVWLLHFMCIHYGGIKGSCSVSSNALEVALLFTCYTNGYS